MVPKVAAKGTSFKGAGAYYLHDKKADSSERVAFTHTENLPVNDAKRALDCMAYTAMHQNEIKAASGAAKTGRKLTAPVYTYSLSWAPDEQPTQEEMIEAGRETLKALGLDEHEVLMVAHNDKPHPHLHLIVNRVHPETGKAAGLSNDHLALSRWAEDYEKRQGEIRCEQRVENNKARRAGNFVKDRMTIDKGAFHRWRRERSKRAFAVRQTAAENLSAYHKRQREVLLNERERRIAAARQEIKERHRPAWAALFRRQKEEWREMSGFQASPLSRLAYWLKHRDLDRSGAVAGAMKALSGHHFHRQALDFRHRGERAALGAQSRARLRKEIRKIDERYRQELDDLKTIQTQERRTLEREHGKESQQRARDMRERRDEQQYRKETGKTLSDEFEFTNRFREQLKKMKERREKEKRKGRDRDGGRER